MLQFLRRHQRYFFIGITVVIGLSFTFFGTFNSMGMSERAPDKEVGKTVTGTAMMQREIALLAHIISTTAADRSRAPNLFNDNVLAKDFLHTGLAQLLVQRHFDQIKPDLEQRMQRVKSYRPYIHPQAPTLNARAIWQQVMPALAYHLTALQQSKELNEQSFAHLGELYLGQAMLPPELLRRILSAQQKQHAPGMPDPNLARIDLALFGFQSAEEWFGRGFLEIACQTIINGAEMAQAKGFSVSTREAKMSLLHNVCDNLQAQGLEPKQAQESAGAAFAENMRNLGVDEEALVGAWKKVLLFRTYFDRAAHSVTLDSLSRKHFSAFASDTVEVELYELSDELRLRDFRSMLKMQCYLDAVYGKGNKGLFQEQLSIERIEKSHPELVSREFVLSFSEVKKEEIAQAVSLQQTWEFELADGNWPMLEKEFSELSSAKARTREQRFAALEKSSHRFQIDEFARAKIVDAHPEWITAALERAEAKEQTLRLRKKGGLFPFGEEREKLFSLLEKNDEQLNCYSPDGKRYFKIKVVKSAPQKELLTFALANRDGTLDSTLDERLTEAYPDCRKKNPDLFKAEQGWKPFAAVRDEIGQVYFADLLSAIEKSAGHTGAAPSLDFYAPRRFLSTMQEARAAFEKGEADAKWFNKESMFHLVKKTKTLKRSGAEGLSHAALFDCQEGSLSQVQTPTSGAVCFFKVIKRLPAGLEQAEIASAQELMAQDVRRALMQELVALMAEKKAIVMTKHDG